MLEEVYKWIQNIAVYLVVVIYDASCGTGKRL